MRFVADEARETQLLVDGEGLLVEINRFVKTPVVPTIFNLKWNPQNDWTHPPDWALILTGFKIFARSRLSR